MCSCPFVLFNEIFFVAPIGDLSRKRLELSLVQEATIHDRRKIIRNKDYVTLISQGKEECCKGEINFQE